MPTKECEAMLDKVNNWFVNQFAFKKQAKNVVKNVADIYLETKAEHPDVSQMDILITIILSHDELFNETFGSSREFLEECCQTIHGACYLIALWGDMVYEVWGWRSQQMANYIDKELETRGFLPQSKEQKERILDAMNKYKFPSE